MQMVLKPPRGGGQDPSGRSSVSSQDFFHYSCWSWQGSGRLNVPSSCRWRDMQVTWINIWCCLLLVFVKLILAKAVLGQESIWKSFLIPCPSHLSSVKVQCYYSWPRAIRGTIKLNGETIDVKCATLRGRRQDKNKKKLHKLVINKWL